MRIPFTNFEVTRAKAPPIPPAGDVTMQFMPPMGNTRPAERVNMPQSEAILDDIIRTERIIRGDPRESWFWTLPNKLTPQQCLNMLRAALAGDLFQQFNLCMLMMDTWPTFRMAAHQLMEASAYARYVVHPYAEEGKKPTAKAIEKADTVNRAIRAFNPNPMNDELSFSGTAYKLCDAMLNGLSLVEIMWELRASSDHGREWMPRAGAWVHPRLYTFSTDGFVALYTDNDYDRIQAGVVTSRPGKVPNPDYFLCGQFISRAGSSLGAGFMRPLVWYWAARQFNLEWMLNTAKQYGSPFIDITYKPGTVSTTGENSELSKLNELLKTAGPQRRLIHPEGSVATIHPSHPLGKENPQRVLEEKADEACLFLLLGQKGTTVSVAGKLGNDDTHENIKDERILGVANWLARNPLRQLARAVLRKNYGNDDECPNIEPDFTKPLKPQEVTAMMTGVSGSRVPVRADEFYKKIGFTQPDPGETVLTGGQLMVQGEAMTEEEQYEQQLERQVDQAETFGALEQEQQANQAADGEVPINVIRGTGTSEGARKGWMHRTRGEAFDALKELRKSGFKGRVSVEKDRQGWFLRKQKGELAKRKPAVQVTPYDAAIRRMKRFRTQDMHGALTDEIYSDKQARAEFEGDNPDADWESAASDLAANYLWMHERYRASEPGMILRNTLVKASDSELDDLEAKILAAESASHKNGEAEEVKAAVLEIAKRY